MLWNSKILFFFSGVLYDHFLFVMGELFMFHYCSYVLKGKVPFTLKHGKADHEATDVSVHKHLMTCLVRQKKNRTEVGILSLLQLARKCKPIEYPKPDGVLSFDVPTSLYRFAHKLQYLLQCKLYSSYGIY